MADKHTKRRSRNEIDHLNDTRSAFPVRKHPTLGSLDSFILHSRHQGSGSSDEKPVDNEGGRNRRTKSDRISVDNTSDTSLTSRGANRSSKRKPKSTTNMPRGSETYHVRNNFYAGIGHSDLDIQTGRPPLMFQMNFIEWLWFQSDTQHRLIFMSLGVLFGITILQVFFGLFWIFSPEQYHNPYWCHTERCTYLSLRLRETINKSVDPCEDFYAFVCGSSDIAYDLPKEEDEQWNYGFDLGRVVYDFRYSPTLGRMLSKMRAKPTILVLEMYQACLEERKRNKLGLEPYFEVLKIFDLYHVSRTVPLTANDVVKSMAKILSHSFDASTILKVNFYKESKSEPIRAYIEPAITEPLRAGSVFRYGYKKYHDTVFEVLSMMKDELNITDNELEILPHDIVCFELFFRDEYSPDSVQDVIDDEDNVGHKPCEFGEAFDGTSIQGNFGNEPNGAFDFELLIRTMYKISNPSWDQNSEKTPFGSNFEDPVKDDRTDGKFIARFSMEFNRSAPIRFMRYLQWRVFYHVGFQLDDTVTNLLVNVERHNFFGKIANCFHCVFTWLPFVAPNTFLKNSDKEINSLIFDFDYTANQTKNIYLERVDLGIAKNMEKVLNMQLTEKEKKIIDRILIIGLRGNSIPPVEFYDRNFIMFRGLYKNLNFDLDHHLKNIIKMGHRIHEWKTNPEYAHTFYEINSAFRVPVHFDKSITTYDRIANRYIIYLPMALADTPFANDGLQVSDFSGLGFQFAGSLEKTFLSSLVSSLSQNYLRSQFGTPEFEDNPVNVTEIDRVESYILDYHGKLKEQFRAQIAEYKVGNKPWNKIRYRSAMDQILTSALHDQSRYQAMSLAVNQFLSNPKIHWRQKKSVLHGLQEYNIKQIFYISLVNRRCDRVGPKKFEQIYEYGPLPQTIRNNLALSNLEDFSETFNCPLGSPMNREEKVYFWDRNFKVNSTI